jgi:hypothetical protein
MVGCLHLLMKSLPPTARRRRPTIDLPTTRPHDHFRPETCPLQPSRKDEAMPRTAAIAATVAALVTSIGLNIHRYPVVWEMAAVSTGSQKSVGAPASSAAEAPPADEQAEVETFPSSATKERPDRHRQAIPPETGNNTPNDRFTSGGSPAPAADDDFSEERATARAPSRWNQRGGNSGPIPMPDGPSGRSTPQRQSSGSPNRSASETAAPAQVEVASAASRTSDDGRRAPSQEAPSTETAAESGPSNDELAAASNDGWSAPAKPVDWPATRRTDEGYLPEEPAPVEPWKAYATRPAVDSDDLSDVGHADASAPNPEKPQALDEPAAEAAEQSARPAKRRLVPVTVGSEATAKATPDGQSNESETRAPSQDQQPGASPATTEHSGPPDDDGPPASSSANAQKPTVLRLPSVDPAAKRQPAPLIGQNIPDYPRTEG